MKSNINFSFLILAIFCQFQVVKSQHVLDTNIHICYNVGGFTGTNAFIGRSVDVIGDLNNDGYIDLIAGDPASADGGTNRGAVWILFMDGNQNVKKQQKISDTQGNFFATLDNGDQFGVGVAGIGDLNQDGIEDVAVGAFSDDDGGTNRGAVYILFLDTGGLVKNYKKISHTSGGFGGIGTNYSSFGQDIDLYGDYNNDGVQDIIVGSHGDNEVGTNHGAAYILLMDTSGELISSSPNYYKLNEVNGGYSFSLDVEDFFGYSIENLGDLNGNGVNDISVGARYDDDGGTNSGAIYILFMGDTGHIDTIVKYGESNALIGSLMDAGDNFGFSQAAGDFDSIPGNELLVASYFDDYGAGSDQGAIYLLKFDGYLLDTVIKFSNDFLNLVLNNQDYFSSGIAFYQEFDNGKIIPIVGSAGNDCGGTNRGKFYFLNITDTSFRIPLDSNSYFAAGNGLSGYTVQNHILNFNYFNPYPKSFLAYSILDSLSAVIAGVNHQGVKHATNSPKPTLSLGQNEVSMDLSPLGLANNKTYKLVLYYENLKKEIVFKY